MRRISNLIVTGLLAATAFACGGKSEGPSGAGDGKSAAPAASSNKDMFVDKYKIGRTVRADGSAGSETDVYQPGEAVNMSFEIRNAPDKTKVRIAFTSLADNRKLGELEKATGKNGFVSFEMKDTKGWAPGAYRVEYFIVNEGEKPRSMGTHDFKMVASRPGG